MTCSACASHHARQSPGQDIAERGLATISGGQGRLLARPSRRVDGAPPVLPALLDRMEHIAGEHDADGLAAVQLGLPWRVVVLRRKDPARRPFYQALINPEWVSSSADWTGSWERCLSVPWGYRYTERASRIKIRYADEHGVTHTETFEGDEAVVLQHELDHLHGQLLSDGLGPRDFVPAARIDEIATAARQDCRADPERGCAHWMKVRWQVYRDTAKATPDSTIQTPR
ncbi:MAG: peptide deformylase [Methylotetracoccus sp.]